MEMPLQGLRIARMSRIWRTQLKRLSCCRWATESEASRLPEALRQELVALKDEAGDTMSMVSQDFGLHFKDLLRVSYYVLTIEFQFKFPIDSIDFKGLRFKSNAFKAVVDQVKPRRARSGGPAAQGQRLPIRAPWRG